MWQVVSAHLPVRDAAKGGRALKHSHRLAHPRPAGMT
jgi:hypothetical protein